MWGEGAAEGQSWGRGTRWSGGALLVGCLGLAVMGSSRGSRHRGRQGIQPRWSRGQAAPGAPGTRAHESLTCHPGGWGTPWCWPSLAHLPMEQGLS